MGEVIYSLFVFLSDPSTMLWLMVFFMSIMVYGSIKCSNLIETSIKEHKNLYEEIKKNQKYLKTNSINSIYRERCKDSFEDFGKWYNEIGVKFNPIKDMFIRYTLAQIALGSLIFYQEESIRAAMILLVTLFLYLINSRAVYYFYKKYILPVIEENRKFNNEF